MKIETKVTNTVKLTKEELIILIGSKFGLTEGKSTIQEFTVPGDYDDHYPSQDVFAGIIFTNEK